jgi:hypothetical protein
MPPRGPFQPGAEVSQPTLVDLAQERKGQVPGFTAGPAQLGRGNPERLRHGRKPGERLRRRRDRHKQPHAAIGIS